MPYYYRAYGLNFISDIKLSPLHQSRNVTDVDVTISKNENLYAQHFQGKESYCLAEVENGVAIFFPDIGVFRVSAGSALEYQQISSAQQDVLLYILGSCMAALWYQREAYLLHANVIKIGNKAIAIAAQSGIGKSTLAAQFFLDGYSVLADDVCVVDKSLHVQPGYPFLKLWQQTIDSLNLPEKQLLQIRLQREKYYYPIEDSFYDNPLPLDSIYIVRARSVKGIVSHKVEGMQKMRALQFNSYRSQYLKNMQNKIQRQYWLNLMNLSGNVRVTRVIRPEQGCTSSELARFIIDDIELH